MLCCCIFYQLPALFQERRQKEIAFTLTSLSSPCNLTLTWLRHKLDYKIYSQCKQSYHTSNKLAVVVSQIHSSYHDHKAVQLQTTHQRLIKSVPSCGPLPLCTNACLIVRCARSHLLQQSAKQHLIAAFAQEGTAGFILCVLFHNLLGCLTSTVLIRLNVSADKHNLTSETI